MTKTTKVLYITYDGLTDPLGQSQILPYVIGLASQGISFVLLSCEKKTAYIKNKDIIESVLNGTGIKWEPIFYTKKPPVISTVYDYWKLKRKAISLYQVDAFNLVHCRSYIPSMIGLWLKDNYNVKYIFDMRGFWADERVDGGLWDLNNILYKKVYYFFKKKEKEFIEKADHIISLTYAGMQEILKWKYVEKQNLPISVIPCCADTNLFDRNKIKPEKIKQIRHKLGLTDKDSIITYLGSVGTWYMLDEMLAFFKIYLETIPNAKFLFITRDNPDYIKSRVVNMEISDEKVLIVSSDREFVPAYASLGQFSLFFIKPTFSKKSSSPTKQGELMSLGIPVVCNAGVGDTDMIVNKYKSGLVVTDFGDEQFRSVIYKLGKTPFDPLQLRNGALDYFSLDQGIASYKNIYDSLLN